jgi:uncharacterized phage infection (PIP) family protein YhgE
MLVVGVVAGVGIGYAITQPTVQQLNSTVSRLQANATSTRSAVVKLSEENANLLAKLNTTAAALSEKNIELSKSLNDLTGNRTQLASIAQKLATIRNATQKLNNDRLLLGELRKNVPSGQEDARVYWKGVKAIAAKVDPTLGPSVDVILGSLDNYFANYIYPLRNSTSPDQFGRILVNAENSGAFDYSHAIDQFQSDAFLTIATHLDQLITLAS